MEESQKLMNNMHGLIGDPQYRDTRTPEFLSRSSQHDSSLIDTHRTGRITHPRSTELQQSPQNTTRFPFYSKTPVGNSMILNEHQGHVLPPNKSYLHGAASESGTSLSKIKDGVETIENSQYNRSSGKYTNPTDPLSNPNKKQLRKICGVKLTKENIRCAVAFIIVVAIALYLIIKQAIQAVGEKYSTINIAVRQEWPPIWETSANYPSYCVTPSAEPKKVVHCHGMSDKPNVPYRINHITNASMTKNTWTILEDKMLFNLPNLIHLDLSQNNITAMSSHAFFGLTQLKKLNLTKNRIEQVHKATFANTKEMTALHMSYNNIKSLQKNTFQKSTKLQEIWLDHNHISEIDRILFTGLHSLSILHLEANNIKRLLSGTFHGLRFFNYTGQLFIGTNRISEFPPGAFSQSTSLEILDITENPVDCSSVALLPDAIIIRGIPDECNTSVNTRSKCDNMKCKHNMKCKETFNEPVCVCMTGYTGKSCEMPVNTCQNNLCKEGTICISDQGSYTCQTEDRHAVRPKTRFVTELLLLGGGISLITCLFGYQNMRINREKQKTKSKKSEKKNKPHK